MVTKQLFCYYQGGFQLVRNPGFMVVKMKYVWYETESLFSHVLFLMKINGLWCKVHHIWDSQLYSLWVASSVVIVVTTQVQLEC